MALPASGTITAAQIRSEFGSSTGSTSSGSVPINLYYRGGSKVPNLPANVGIPTSGTIQWDDFYNSRIGTATWTSRSIPVGSTVLLDATYGGGSFAVTGDGSPGGNVYHSTTGTTWSQAFNPMPNTPPSAIGYGNGLFLLAGVNNFSSNVHVGVSGSAGGPYSNNTLGVSGWSPNTIAYGAGIYVLAGTGGNLYTSFDTLSWTPRTSSFAGTTIRRIIFAGGQFVAVGDAEKVATSPDGINWTQRGPLPFSGTPNATGLAYGNGFYMATANANNFASMATSPDGISWTVRSGRGTGCGFCDSGFFLAVPTSASSGTFCYDVQTQITTNKLTSNDFVFAVAGNNSNRFIVAGSNNAATQPRLYTVDIT